VLGDAVGVEGVQHIIACRCGLGAHSRGAAADTRQENCNMSLGSTVSKGRDPAHHCLQALAWW
jgi:hypothetical protein